MNIPIRTPGKSIMRSLIVNEMAAIVLAEQADARLKNGEVVEFKTAALGVQMQGRILRPSRICHKRTKAEKKALRKAQTREKLGIAK